MSVNKQFADTRKAQQASDGGIDIRIPVDVVEEFGIQKGDDVLFTCREGSETAELHRPARPPQN